tara:strand:+ start:510 stop:1481 length:972 start_codon:yes stop_codon:yes gene_type:complete
MRLRVINIEEAELKYGNDYISTMGFNEDGHMDYLLGFELSEDNLDRFHTSVADGLAIFNGLFGASSWSIKTEDITIVSKDIWIRDKQWFIDEYKREDFWNHEDCIFVDEMQPYFNEKLSKLDRTRFIDKISRRSETFLCMGWNFKFDWFTDVKPDKPMKVKDKPTEVHMNTIVIHRGNVEITISQERGDSETIFFVDGEDGESYEINKKDIAKPKEGSKYVLKARNIITDKLATKSITTILQGKSSYEGLEFYASRDSIESINLDSLLSAVYSIKDFESEYEEVLISNFLKNNYPSLTKDNLNHIEDGIKKITKLSSIFQVEA